jgi:nitrogen fixation/metabolism regulation signal transduction histidine kinase
LALLAALVLVAIGGAWELARFGRDASAASLNLEAEVQAHLRSSAARLQRAAADVARQGQLVGAASQDRDRIPELFANLPAQIDAAVTVYVPTGAGDYRVLAWSDGPAEDLPVPAGARETPTLLVAQGTLGLRLVAWHPIRLDTRLVGVVAAEQILSTTGGLHPSLGEYRLTTSFGPVLVTQAGVGLAAGDDTDQITIRSDAGTPLLDVVFSPATLDAARMGFRRRVWLVAGLPLIALLPLLSAHVLVRRRRLGVVIASALVAIAGVSLAWLARGVGAPLFVMTTLGALTAVGLALSGPVTVWWRASGRRAAPHLSPARMLAELLAGGLVCALLLWLTYWAIDRQVTLVDYDHLASPLFPVNIRVLTAHAGRLLLALASTWSVATILGRQAERWRLSWRRPFAAVIPAALWVLPTLAALAPNPWNPLPTWAVASIAGVAAAFALAAVGLRSYYRHASQSTRLLCLFAATALPAVAWYPVVAFTVDRNTEHLIATSYAPATMDHPQQLIADLTQATADIDHLPDLEVLLSHPPGADQTTSTDAAFLVWSQTGLSRLRLTSALELYGPDGRLTSRFALNVPEYGIDRSAADPRCSWDTYGEVSYGTEEQALLHAERSICDESGKSLGAVVIHVMFDYRALPFISALNPYDDLLRSAGQQRRPRPEGIQTVVYGWGRVPRFTSGQIAWTLDPALLNRIEQSRTPFWTTQYTDAGEFRVYFTNNRAGIYALGYPVSSLFDHLTRLAETTAVAALLFLLLLAVTPLGTLVTEVRTSFYRKLFLFFVFTAVVPVLVLAVTFSAYMTGKLRSDVETEAQNAATIARRVLEDTIALQQLPLSDDVLVWISQVINQDVNLYDGSRLRATSQRDLFDSGLLPERTPSTAYRAIALDRLPSFVAEDRTESFRYLVAAAPVPALGRQALLSVPLALRQQEIEREITDLNRGVLLGAVCVILLAAFLGASVAQRVSDPVERLTRATQQIAAGRLDVRIVADTADELRRLVTDFNSMAATLREQRAELGRTHELKAWADMSRQVAHDIKNPLTPIQLAAEHLQRVHEDQQRPLGPVFDQCISTVLAQVRLLRQIANEFSNFATAPTPRPVRVPLAPLLEEVVRPYRAGLAQHTHLEVVVAPGTPDARVDRTLLARALTNLIENALQAMPSGGRVRLLAQAAGPGRVSVVCEDTGVGMSAEAVARAFEPHFSTKTSGSGLGLANARRNIEACGGDITMTSTLGQGTTLTVTLPEAGPEADAIA